MGALKRWDKNWDEKEPPHYKAKNKRGRRKSGYKDAADEKRRIQNDLEALASRMKEIEKSICDCKTAIEEVSPSRDKQVVLQAFDAGLSVTYKAETKFRLNDDDSVES